MAAVASAKNQTLTTVATKERTVAREKSLNCVIAQGTKLEGNLTSSENIRIDGTLVGDIKCDRKVVIGPKGRVEGKVNAADAVILGTVVGEVVIASLLHLEKSAVITGNMQASNLIVEEGAVCDGDFKIG